MSRFQSWFADLRYAARHPWAKAALVCLLISLVFNGAVLAYWWPAHREHQTLTTRVDSQRRAIVDARRATDIARAYEAARSNVSLLEQKLNVSGGQADLVTSLGRLATKRHVRIASQAYEEGKVKNEYLPLYLNIGLQADYSSLREFLADLFTLPVWVEIQEMNLEQTREHPGLIKASLRLLTYRKIVNRPPQS